jgi:hypothetical protein
MSALRRLTMMAEAGVVLEKLHDEFVRFQSRMAELCLLRQVASDLKSYRRMIKVKRYD